MDLRGLRHVVVLARVLSYTKAAEELGLTQSALSRSIQAIETRAGVRLFDRDRGGVHLTTVGRDFVERGAALLREADELDRVLKSASAGSQGAVALGMAPLPAAVLAPAAICEGLRTAPELRSAVFVRTTEALLSMLVKEQIEFLVCTDSQMPQGAPVKAAPLGTLPISRLVRPDHPLLSGGNDRGPEDFPLIVSAAFEAPESVSLYRQPQVVLEDHGALMRITECSDAIWLSSSFAAAEEILQGRLKELPWPSGHGPRQFSIAMYSLSRRSLSPAAARLRDQFRSRIRELTQLFVDRATQLDSADIRSGGS